ncbi:hypothetical protein [Thermomonospora echinospora]|uniref:hypothetical protein n=1 Tax=Thermomonospora echinospora TaxID=1992 RepID=UPI0011B069F2|nr:hypothetical protein [Thermomonospora echinospora]
MSYGALPEQLRSVAGPATGPLRGQCATALQHLYGWLQVAVPQQPQLATAIPPLVQAVQLYRAGLDDACAAQLQWVIAQLHQTRVLRPTLPPL